MQIHHLMKILRNYIYFRGKIHQHGASIHNELEANLYGRAIGLNQQMNTENWWAGGSTSGMGNTSWSGKTYERIFNSLLNEYSEINFLIGRMTFKSGSEKNASGGYNNYPLIRKNQKKSIIKNFYPLIK